MQRDYLRIRHYRIKSVYHFENKMFFSFKANENFHENFFKIKPEHNPHYNNTNPNISRQAVISTPTLKKHFIHTHFKIPISVPNSLIYLSHFTRPFVPTPCLFNPIRLLASCHSHVNDSLSCPNISHFSPSSNIIDKLHHIFCAGIDFNNQMAKGFSGSEPKKTIIISATPRQRHGAPIADQYI